MSITFFKSLFYIWENISNVAKNWGIFSQYTPNEFFLIHQILNLSRPEVSRHQFYTCLSFYISSVTLTYNCNQFLHESQLNFDKLLTHWLLSFMENIYNLLSRLEYFQTYKRGLKSKWGWLKWCRTDASLKLMSCITIIDFCFGLLEFKIWWIKRISSAVDWEKTHQFFATFETFSQM